MQQLERLGWNARLTSIFEIHDRRGCEAARDGDDRGRHTTTSRELVQLPGGALAIDTPGMRELGMWDATEGIGRAFEDVEALRAGCHYRDCQHGNEPRCAVLGAIADGTLTSERLQAYLKLQREVAHQARREDHRLAWAEKQRWKKVAGK